MINQNQIIRLIEAQEYTHLIERILANGRCRSIDAKRALIQPESATVAALGLALQRLTEITYRPTPAAESITNRLIAHQRDDGFFADADDDDLPEQRCEIKPGQTNAIKPGQSDDRRQAIIAPPRVRDQSHLAATAVAVRGLIAFATQRELAREFVPDSVQLAIDRALAAIARRYEMIETKSANNHRVETSQHAVAWAIVLWQLGDIVAFRAQVPVDDLLETLDDTAADLIEDELCRYAHAMAA